MESKLQIFTNDEFGSVRIVDINGEPWFVGKDIADNLGYQNGSRDINRHVEMEDKMKNMIFDGNQKKETILINESGLYSLILSSKLPSAKKFKHWITSEVLPSIRKHGMYMTDNMFDAVIEKPEIIGQVIEKMKADKIKVTALESRLKSALPKAVYFDNFVDPGYAICFRDTAKEFEIPPRRFISLLIEYKFIFRTLNNELRPMAKALEKSLFILRDYTSLYSGHRGTYTLVTAKGKKYIYEYFKKKGII